MELGPFLVLYCFFVFIFVFFGVILVNCLHFRRIVVVCGGRLWGIPRRGIVYVHSFIFCVLIHSCNFFFLIFIFWYFCILNFFFLLCRCHSCSFLLVILCCHSWELILIVVTFLHFCEIFGVVIIFVVGGVTILDRIFKAVEEINSGILVLELAST